VDRPVDVRLAEALGYKHPEEIPELMTTLWSKSYDWCGEGAELNEVALVPFRSVEGRIAWHAFRRAEFRDSAEYMAWSRNVAYCEWLIGTINAGVCVVLPSGRVINGGNRGEK
jgi:hypothetical protein